MNADALCGSPDVWKPDSSTGLPDSSREPCPHNHTASQPWSAVLVVISFSRRLECVRQLGNHSSDPPGLLPRRPRPLACTQVSLMCVTSWARRRRGVQFPPAGAPAHGVLGHQGVRLLWGLRAAGTPTQVVAGGAFQFTAPTGSACELSQVGCQMCDKSPDDSVPCCSVAPRHVSLQLRPRAEQRQRPNSLCSARRSKDTCMGGTPQSCVRRGSGV